MKVINEIAPRKEMIKNNNQDWFHREIADLIHVQENCLPHIDEEIYKNVRNQVRNLKKEGKFL